MAFIVRNQKTRSELPPGNYIEIKGVEWQILNISINASGSVCLKLKDPIRLQTQIVTVCNIADLAKMIPEAE